MCHAAEGVLRESTESAATHLCAFRHCRPGATGLLGLKHAPHSQTTLCLLFVLSQDRTLSTTLQTGSQVPTEVSWAMWPFCKDVKCPFSLPTLFAHLGQTVRKLHLLKYMLSFFLMLFFHTNQLLSITAWILKTTKAYNHPTCWFLKLYIC